MFVVVLFALSANIATVWGQTSIKDQQRAARRVFNKEAKGASLKGGNGNSIPSLSVSYCSEDGSVVVSIDVDDLEDATASIDWRIREFVGGETYHPEWGDIEGSGRNTTLRFYPSRVDAQFHNSTAIYISAFEKDGSGFVIKGTHDFTTVYATPAEFTIGTDQAICAGLTVSLTLDGSEEDVEYQLKRDGVDVSFPLAGNGNPLTWNGISDGGVYTVTANNSIENSCSKDMLGSATLTVYNLPNPVATNGGNVCLGDDIELFADPDGLTSYTWTDPATTEIGTTQDVTVSSTGYGVGTHTFTLSVEDANTCVNTVTTNVTVYEIPNVTATNSGPVCLNGDITISSTVTGGQAPYNYTWTHVPSGTTYNTDAFTLNNVALDKAGEYQLVVTDANNCSPATASTIVVINENPTVTLPAGPTNVCEGNALTLTATANGGSGVYDTYTWYFNGAEIVGQTAATLTINPAAIANGGNYTVIVTDNNGCVSPLSNVSTVVIIPNFTPTVTNDSPVCEGGDVQLSCTSGPYVDYSWTGPDGFSSILQNPVVSGITLAGAGNYSLTVTDANGCTGTEVTNVLVNENPTVTVADNGPLCVGGSAIITATPAGGAGPYTFSWTHNANPLVPTGNVITIDPVALADAGDYVVSVTDNNTCSSVVSATTTLLVNDNPTVSLSYNNPVCENGTLTLTATAAGGSGVYNTYAWTKGGVAIPGETGATLTIDPATLADAGDYGVTVIDNSGCSSTEDIVTVVINALPAVTATNNGPICEGDQLELTGGPGGMTTYSWTGPNGYTNATQSPIVSANATLAMSGAYQLEVFDGTCSASATTNVVINTVTAVLTHTPASFTVCENTLLTFSANGQDGSGNYEYEFFVNGVSQGPASTTNALPLTITSNVNVEVEVTDTNTGCKDRADTDITMIANPVIAITSPNDMDEFCTGEPITFNFTPGYTEYVLYAGPAGTPTELYRGATPSFTLAAGFNTTTDVAVSAENISGCSALSNIITIVINNRPTPTITGDTEVCANDAKTYTTDSGSGESNWQWNVTGGTIVGADNTASVDVVWDGPAPHTITVNYDNSDGCPAVTPTSQAITVNPLPVPTVTGDNIVCNGSTVTYSTETGMTGYTWVVTGGNLDSQDDAAGTATVTWSTVGTQNLTVSYTDANSCSPATPFAYGVQVVALPSPTITGDNVVCTEHTYTYSTEPGATNYNWQIVGGTITPTANDHEVNVVWNTSTGTEQISVNYELAACPAATPTILNVTVNTVPTPAIVGSLNVCANSTESYEANILGLGKGQYTWLVTGGTPTGDLDDESVEVIWNGTAPHTISLNYVNANGCDAVNPTVENVTVNALPLPVITGPAVACDGSTVTYSTETGMTAYIWNVVGGTLDSQDDAAGAATVTWNVVGMQSIGVTYTDGNNCNPSTPTIYNVEVVSLPSPTITGDNIVCTEHTYTYITEAGASNYDWQIVGGTITPTANPHEVSVVWNLLGAQSISVNYDVAGCPASAPTVQNVTVSAVPTPSIVGNLTVCANSTETYSANTLGLGKGQYTWLITGGTPTGDLDEESVEVLWDGTAPHTISLNYVNVNGCDAVNPTLENVTVNALPVPTISGPAAACKDYEVDYTTEAGMTGTTWNVLSGGVIQSQDDATGTVTVLWNATGSHKLTVTYTDANGCVAQMPIEYDVNVQDIPTPSLNGLTDVCNQQTVTYTTEAGMTNYDWQIASGGSIETNDDNGTITVLWNTDGDHTLSVNYELAGGCAAPNATQVTVTVKPLPAAPTFVVAPGNSIVAGTDLTFTAGGGANYTFDINGDVKQGPGAATDYLASTSDPTPDVVDGDIVSVIIESANGCSVSRSITMNVFEGMIQYNVLTNRDNYCFEETGVNVYLENSQAGITYELRRVSDNVQIGTAIVSDGTARVEWTNVVGDLPAIEYKVIGYHASVPADQIDMSNTVSITRHAEIVEFTMSPTDAVDGKGTCGTTTPITLNGSENDVTYYLLVNGTNTGTSRNGDTNPLDFGVHNTAGVYTINAVHNVTGCERLMAGSWEIEGTPPANTYNVLVKVSADPTAGRFCSGDAGVNIYLSNSDDGIDYELFLDGASLTPAVILTGPVGGGELDFGVHAAAGQYTVRVNQGGCYYPMNGLVNVSEVALPIKFNLIAEDNGFYCPADPDGVELSLDNQEVDVFYHVFRDGVELTESDVDPKVALPVRGAAAGTSLQFGNYITVGNYHVEARIADIGCPVITDAINVAVDAIPQAKVLEGETTFCEGGGTALLYMNNPEADVIYELVLDGTPTGDNGNAGTGRLEWSVNASGIYKIQGIKNNTTTSCGPVDVTAEVTVNMTSLPEDKVVEVTVGDPALCEGVIIKVKAPQVSMRYAVVSNITNLELPGYSKMGDEVNGDGDVEFERINDDGGRYRVVAYNATCERILDQTGSGDVNEIIVYNPAAIGIKQLVGPDAICEGEGLVTIQLLGADVDVHYNLYRVNTSGADILVQEDVTGVTGDINFNPIGDEGEYYAVGYRDVPYDASNPCNNEMLNRITIRYNPLPIAFKFEMETVICGASEAVLGLEGSQNNYQYYLTFHNLATGKENKDVQIGDGNPITFDNMTEAGKYTVYAISDQGCSSSMKDTVEVGFSSSISNFDIVGAAPYEYCDAEAGYELRLNGQEENVTYRVFDAADDLKAEHTGDNSGTELVLGTFEAGTYRIEGSKGGECVLMMNSGNTVVITANSSPQSFNVTTTEFVNICQGITINIALDGSEDTRVYNVVDDLDNVVATATGDGNALTIPLVCDEVGDNLYEVIAVGNPSCDLLLDVVRVSVKTGPAQPVVEPTIDMNYCWDAEGVKVSLTAVEAGIDYYIVDEGTGNRISFLSGDAGEVEFKEFVLTGTYHVVAKSFESGCDAQSVSFTINAYSEIQLFNMQVGTPSKGFETIDEDGIGYGSVNADTIKLDNSTVGVTYTLLKDKLELVPTVELPGSGSPLDYKAMSDAGLYTVLATENGCTRLMAGSVKIYEKPLVAVNDILPVPYGKNQADTSVWKNDISDAALDIIVAGDDKNIFFSLVDLSKGANYDLLPEDNRITEMNTDIGNNVKIYPDGRITFTKLPTFYGRDSIDYVVFNTDYIDRRDTARVYFFAGNYNVSDNDNLLIPNAFSPNEDGYNDRFVISGRFESEVAESKLEVYNRWGSIVYRSKGKQYNEDFWDGTSNAGMVSLGKKLPSGTYFYVFKIDIIEDTTDDGVENGVKVSKEYSGFIELRR
jgi:gliding motility-associated-like protein